MAQRTASSHGVTATLWAVVEEIDDDDEDILEVTIDVSNGSNWDLWDIKGDIRAMDGTHAQPLGAPSRIESGNGEELKFWVPSDTGAWLFKIDYNTDSGSGSVELGPFTNDLRIEGAARPSRTVSTSMNSSAIVEDTGGGDPLAAAFGAAMDGFGDDEKSDSILGVEATSNDPMQAAFAGGLLASQQTPSAPVSAPLAPLAPPAGPPSPPAAAPLASPAGPPSPPAAAPLAPPAGPPSPPSGPPSSPPAFAPAADQFNQPPGPPTGPPSSSPPSGPPGRPPGPPPSGSPPGAPPKSGKPPGPPPS